LRPNGRTTFLDRAPVGVRPVLVEARSSLQDPVGELGTSTVDFACQNRVESVTAALSTRIPGTCRPSTHLEDRSTIMGIGVGVLLLAIGAILAFAVDASVSGLDLSVVGWILMVAGAVALVFGAMALSRTRGETIVTDRSIR